jgi:transcriptional regulator with XRE-family HTH domain
MSELYLILRSRLEAVTNWVPLGSNVMREARDNLGLSREAVARLIPVSAKTYERWEKRGAVPVEWVEKTAGVIGLEVERVPMPTRVTLATDQTVDLKVIAAQLEATASVLMDSVATLGALLPRLQELLRPEDDQQADEKPR